MCVQGSTKKKLRDSQEQLAELSSARVASKLQAIPWTQTQASLSSQQQGLWRSLQVRLSPLPGVSTTLWRPHSAMGTMPSLLIHGFTQCSSHPEGEATGQSGDALNLESEGSTPTL